MFSTFKQRLLLGIYIFVIISIPIGAYLVSQSQTIKSSASEEKSKKTVVKIAPKSATSSAKQALLDLAKKDLITSAPTPSPEPSSPTIATTFGPTLSFKAKLEGRAENNQATKLFVGIIEGALSANPKYILNFSVNLPASGEYSGLSLAGLTSGSTYTALLKGPAQIATAVSFTMAPNETKLNSLSAILLTSGDLNEDNTVNSTDLGIMKSALGSNKTSSNWKEIADINTDGVVNIIDYSILYKNMGKSGDSGVWVSPIPTASSSAQLTPTPAIGTPNLPDGHWIWIPK